MENNNQSESRETEFNEEYARAYFKLLGHEKETEVRVIGPKTKDSKSYHVSSEDEFVEVCRKYNGLRNIYAGVHERVAGGKGKKDVVSVKQFIIDIDCANKPASEKDLKLAFETAQQIKRDYGNFSIIFSGNGYQLFKKIPKTIITDSNRKDVENKIILFGKEIIEKYSNEKVKLDNVYDLPRVMRVPGTINLKSKTLSKIFEIDDIEDAEFSKKIFDRVVFEVKQGKATPQQIEAVNKEVRIEKLVDMSTFKELTNRAGEYQGSNPYFPTDSTTHLDINVITNTYYDWKENHGGSALELYATGKGIIGRGEKLGGENFHKAVLMAIDEFNIKVDDKLSSNLNQPILTPRDEESLIFGSEVDNYKEKERNDLVDRVIERGVLAAMVGKSGSFKSIQALHFSLAISHGKKVFGKFDVKNKERVLFVCKEGSKQYLLDNIKALARGLQIESISNDLIIWYSPNLSLDTEEGREKLCAVVKKYNVKFVVIDSYRRVVHYDENSATETNRTLNALIDTIIHPLEVTILFIHHTGKSDSQGQYNARGSSDFVNIVDTNFEIKRRGKRETVEFEFSKVRGEVPPTQNIRIDYRDGVCSLWIASEKTEKEAPTLKEQCKEDIMALVSSKMLKDNFTKQDVMNMLKAYSEDAIKKALTLLCDSDVLVLFSAGKNSHYKIVDTDAQAKLEDSK